jgi:hypothetical protein
LSVPYLAFLRPYHTDDIDYLGLGPQKSEKTLASRCLGRGRVSVAGVSNQ